MKDAFGAVPDWTIIPPMKGPHGDQYVSFEQFQGNSWAISVKAAKDPEKLNRIMSLLQYWYTDKEAYPYFAYGTKGINWEMVDNKPQILQENKKNKELMAKWTWQGNYWLPRRTTDSLYFNYTYDKTAPYLALNQKYIKANKVNPYVQPDSTDTMYNDRIKFVNETFLKFILGKESIQNWDQFVNTLNSKYGYEQYQATTLKQLQEAGVKPS